MGKLEYISYKEDLFKKMIQEKVSWTKPTVISISNDELAKHVIASANSSPTWKCHGIFSR
jgi:hypothetical protein